MTSRLRRALGAVAGGLALATLPGAAGFGQQRRMAVCFLPDAGSELRARARVALLTWRDANLSAAKPPIPFPESE